VAAVRGLRYALAIVPLIASGTPVFA